MKRMSLEVWALPIALSLFFAGCSNTRNDPKAEAPSPVKVENEDFRVIYVDHPEQFTLATAVEYVFIQPLTATGTVQADISRTVPVGWKPVECCCRCKAPICHARCPVIETPAASISRA